MELTEATFLVIEYLAVAIIAGMVGYRTKRTFLSWALMVEVEGRWLWQQKHGGAEPGGHSK